MIRRLRVIGCHIAEMVDIAIIVTPLADYYEASLRHYIVITSYAYTCH